MSEGSEPINLVRCQSKVMDIAREAAKIMIRMRDALNECQIQQKASYADLVTEADVEVQEKIRRSLQLAYPSFKFIGEEKQNNVLTDDPTWIVDPIDGTMNFVHGNPHTAICIGLAIKKVPVLGVVNFPFLEQIFYAIVERDDETANQDAPFKSKKIKRALMCGKELKVKKATSLRESLVAAEIGSDRSEEKRRCVFQNLNSVAWQCHGVRSYGSAAANICAVASGHLDAYYEFGLHSWDMCGPLAILLGAGGYYCDTTGEEAGEKFNLCKRRLIAAGSKEVAEELSKALVCQLELPSD